MKKPCEIFEGLAQFTRREGGTGRKPSRKFFENFFKIFFSGSYYRVAGGGYFTTFLKQNFENLICDGKLFENFELNRRIREKFRKRF